MLMLAFCYTFKKEILMLIQVVTLTYVGCTFCSVKNMSHEHDPGCNIAWTEIDECSKLFIGVAIILSQMK